MKTASRILLLSLLLFSVSELTAQKIAGAYTRASTSLNGEWHYIIDPYENGYYNYRREAFDLSDTPSRSAYFMDSKPASKSDLIEYDFSLSDQLRVPGDWNSQSDKLLYYEGTVWYQRLFDYSKSVETNRVFLRFGAANYEAEVYLNGRKLGTHTGGFTPFEFEITGLVKREGNTLVVKVDNTRHPEAVPTVNTDWWNYGGLTRSVDLIEVPATYIADHYLQLDPQDAGRIKGRITLEGPGRSNAELRLIVKEAGIDLPLRTDRNGVAEVSVPVSGIRLWTPEEPRLYDVSITSGKDVLKDRIGFRTVRTSGNRILLNGKDVFLRGISIHEENPLRGGRAYSRDDAKQLLIWAKDLGCNFVRLAHYPHNENMVRVADEMGILVWEEIPVYWTIQWNNPETLLNAESQLSEAVTRDRNRASVIIWSMANETPVSDARDAFLGSLAATARGLDPTRLISAALEQSGAPGDPDTRMVRDPFAKNVDVISFNEYIGWYDGLPDKTESIKWDLPKDKPILISEFGAGAKYGFHADRETRWSEEFQEDLYRKTLKMLERIPNLRGMSPWILVDFRSPRRHLPRIQDGWNRKGLISDKGEKKKAYFVLRDYYSRKQGRGPVRTEGNR